MEFKFDKRKSVSNFRKHGMDFQAAQRLWNDPNLVELDTKAVVEPRRLIIGKIEDKHWSAIITYRDNAIRLISVRRSRKKEVLLYEKNNN